MTMTATAVPQRRGACPGLSAPMPTGDGLLVRLIPIGTVSLAAFAALCAAARKHGNGVVEITSRGSVQVRGLSEHSAPQFAADIAALSIAAQDGVPIICNALAGIDPEEIFDAASLAADLRRALTQRSFVPRLGAKVSVVIDGGGSLNLAKLSADIRLGAQTINGEVLLRIGVGGDDQSAIDLGMVAPARGVEAVARLLELIARRGRDARAGDMLAAGGPTLFGAAVADLLEKDPPPQPARRSGEAVGAHRLRDGSLACGIGLAFGHADAAVLERLIDAACAAGASGLRTAPGRTLMTIGLRTERMAAFAVAAARLGFIVRADDPRCHVIACAGAPICSSAHMASRAIAPAIAAAAAPHIDGSSTIHISGCAKGCAHAAPATLTIVGTPDGCEVVANGAARDTPFAVVSANELPATIAEYLRVSEHEAGHV